MKLSHGPYVSGPATCNVLMRSGSHEQGLPAVAWRGDADAAARRMAAAAQRGGGSSVTALQPSAPQTPPWSHLHRSTPLPAPRGPQPAAAAWVEPWPRRSGRPAHGVWARQQPNHGDRRAGLWRAQRLVRGAAAARRRRRCWSPASDALLPSTAAPALRSMLPLHHQLQTQRHGMATCAASSRGSSRAWRRHRARRPSCCCRALATAPRIMWRPLAMRRQAWLRPCR